MKDISLHIMDIAQNSIVAGASEIIFTIEVSPESISLMIYDNGKGISAEMLENVTDPFTTSRTTRPVGLGLPLIKQNAEATEGNFNIESDGSTFTRVKALFKRSHIDCLPMGDLAGVLTLLITSNPNINITIDLTSPDDIFIISTRDIQEELEGESLNNPVVYEELKNFISNNINPMIS